jgi:hypothetical protein
MAAGQWFLHWKNAPLHSAAMLRMWLIKHNIQVPLLIISATSGLHSPPKGERAHG